MDPISIVVELEIATLLLAGVGALATWIHKKNHEANHRQREQHHRELKALRQQERADRMKASGIDPEKKLKSAHKDDSAHKEPESLVAE